MKKSYSIILVFGITFLFFIQLAGTLVESIYILDLMNSNLDEKAAGVLFFFTPLLLIPFYKKYRQGLVWASFTILLLSRGLLPYLTTANRVLAAGLGTFAALSLFFLLLGAKPKGETRSRLGLWGSAGLALAVSLSALLRTIDYGIDYSLTAAGGWVGWALFGLALGYWLAQLDFRSEESAQEKKGGVTSALLGLYLILTLVWFAFSAPAVIARWTEGSYPLIVIAVSLFSAGWVLLAVLRPQWLDRISPRGLLLWNLLFTLSLTSLLLAHRVSFPPTPESAPVVVTSPGWPAQVLLVIMLLLFPVIFLDTRLFLNRIRQAAPSPRDLVPGILLGGFVMIFLVFAHIFTNVWGYVAPVSTPFRNTFWLTYFLMTGIVTLLVWLTQKSQPASETDSAGSFHWGWALLLGTIFIVTAVRAFPGERVQVDGADRTSLVAMTFNTQQSNDDFAEKSADAQLALIRRVNPDILALQESDSARISLNNNDYVRYFAEKLGYHSYYGPTPGTGTFGTAILSRYPLLNPRSVFIYSDKDETGVAEAEIEVGGRTFTIYNVHPDSSDAAMLIFARTLLERSKDKADVIALGDYNLRDYEEPYQLIDSVLTNAWTSVYPTEIGADWLDMSGENRIDHIFISPTLGVRNPAYVLPPESATDHPVHWAEITWGNP
jgi:endonuclease/exonuclease/phosphatase family metal-dependent hydrolase